MLEDLDVEEPPARSTGPTPSGEKEKGGEVKQEAAGTCVCVWGGGGGYVCYVDVFFVCARLQ